MSERQRFLVIQKIGSDEGKNILLLCPCSKYGACVSPRKDGVVVSVPWLSSTVYCYESADSLLLTHDLGCLVELAGDRLQLDETVLLAYYKKGESYSTKNPYKNVRSIYPGSRLTFRQGRQVTEETPPDFSCAGASVDIDSLEASLCESLANGTRGKNVAFALSGGVDSTLLVALSKAHAIVEKPICYCAVTGRGNDLAFARRAAESLAVELREVNIPTDESALKQHWRMTRAAGCPVSFAGNALGFSFVSRAVKRDGFDAIVDGTGSDQIFAGTYMTHGLNWYSRCLRSGEHELSKTFRDYCLSNNLLTEKDFESAGREIQSNSSFTEYLYDQITRRFLQLWVSQHTANAACNGIQIITPYLDEKAASYIANGLGFFFERGVNKFRLRSILSKYAGADVAWRIDNQGLRIRRDDIYRDNAATIRKMIFRAAWLLARHLGVVEVSKFALNISSERRVVVLYQLGVFLETLRGGQPPFQLEA